MSKIKDYNAVTRFDSGDILLKDGTNGTKKIGVKDAAIDLAGMISAVHHRQIYREKNLGAYITDTQKAAIKAGTFDDLYIGDYWTIDDVRYDIADMDYWYNTGDEPSFTKHHLVMVPHSGMYTAGMNEMNTTEGGYVGSHMYIEGLKRARDTISNAFGNMLLTHRNHFVNAVTNGKASAAGWFDSTVDLMNEIMVCGSYIRAVGDSVAVVDKTQLALFSLNPRALNVRQGFWLRDVASASYFAYVSSNGRASAAGASDAAGGVRPAFAIG